MKKIGEEICALGSKWQKIGKVGVRLFVGGIISLASFVLIQLVVWGELHFFDGFALTPVLTTLILIAIVLGIFLSPLYLCGMFAICFGQIEINTRNSGKVETKKENNDYVLPTL